MAGNNGPKIVTNGLIFAVDGADRKSLSGTGATAWNELSGTGKSGTITGATFNSSNGGALSFTAGNSWGVVYDYLIGANNPRTVSIWAYSNSTGDTCMFSTRPDQGSQLGYLIGTSGGTLNLSHIGVGSVGLTVSTLNTWFNVVCTYTGTTATIIFNNTTSNSGTLNFNNVTSAGGVIGNGSVSLTSLRPWGGLIANVLSYNRVLTSSELTQNFNAYRRRFNI